MFGYNRPGYSLTMPVIDVGETVSGFKKGKITIPGAEMMQLLSYPRFGARKGFTAG